MNKTYFCLCNLGSGRKIKSVWKAMPLTHILQSFQLSQHAKLASKAGVYDLIAYFISEEGKEDFRLLFSSNTSFKYYRSLSISFPKGERYPLEIYNSNVKHFHIQFQNKTLHCTHYSPSGQRRRVGHIFNAQLESTQTL